MTTAALVSNATVHTASAAVPGFDEAYEIAYLRGGAAEVIHLALFALIQRGALEITERRRSLAKVRRLCQASRGADAVGPLERAVHRFVSSPRRASEMLAPELRSEVEALSAPYRRALEARGYLRSPREHQQVIAIVALGALGVALLAFSVMGFWPAIVLSAVAAILCRWWAPALRISVSGHRAIKQARIGLDRGTDGRPVAPSLAAVAVLGLNILEDTDFDALALMFSKSADKAHGDSTGCSCDS